MCVNGSAFENSDVICLRIDTIYKVCFCHGKNDFPALNKLCFPGKLRFTGVVSVFTVPSEFVVPYIT